MDRHIKSADGRLRQRSAEQQIELKPSRHHKQAKIADYRFSTQSRIQRGNRLNRPGRVFMWIVLILMALTMLVPMINVVAVSFSGKLGSMQPGVILWPRNFTAEGYNLIWNRANLSLAFFNSTLVSILSVIIEIFLSTLAAYVLIQTHLPGRRLISAFILLTMMIPGDLTLISIYSLNKQLHLVNTYAGLILNGLLSGFSIFLLRNYFSSVPQSLAESARVDAATEFQVFSKIYIPLSVPGIAAVTFLSFIGKWNALMIPVTIISDASKYTLPMVLKELAFSDNSVSGMDYIAPNAKMAAIIISVLPLILLYAFAQRYLIEGLTLGANKG